MRARRLAFTDVPETEMNKKRKRQFTFTFAAETRRKGTEKNFSLNAKCPRNDLAFLKAKSPWW